jgi:hypothetical protein
MLTYRFRYVGVLVHVYYYYYCRSIDIFSKDCILLADVSELTK